MHSLKITHKFSAALYDIIKIIVFKMIRTEVSTKCQALTSRQSRWIKSTSDIINSSQCAPLFWKLILQDEMRLLPDLCSQLVLWVLDVSYPWNILYLKACLWQWYFEWKSAFYFIWSGFNYIHNASVLNHISLPWPYLLMTPVLAMSTFIFGLEKAGYAKEKSKCDYGLQVSKWPRPAIFAFYIYV